MLQKSPPGTAVCPIVTDELQGSLDTLERAFGAPFQLWIKQTDWCALTQRPESGPGPASDTRYLESLNECDASRKPIVTTSSNRGHRVVVPIEHPDRIPCAATSVVKGRDPELVARLAATASRLIEKTSELDTQSKRVNSYAKYVSGDYEQLSWLHDLTKYFEGSDPRQGIEVIAQTVLPALRELIEAQSIVLLEIEPHAPASHNEDRTATRTFDSVGEAQINDQVHRRLVACFGAKATPRPFVNNHVGEHHALADVMGLHSCILVPVAAKDYQFGWLLALNKMESADALAQNAEFCPQGLSEQEFGTVEASLMNAAAIMLAAQARNAELFRERESLMIGIIRALINAMDAKDSYTFGHSDRVAQIAKRIAKELGQDEQSCERIFLAGVLHDIGKIGVPDDVLLKPGKLNDEEFRQVKQHPTIAHNILKHLDLLTHVMSGVLHHHESVDGHGYPNQLAGDEIPIAARIIAVADAYDAMTSSRPYRDAMSAQKAESIIRQNAGKQWDADVVAAFFEALDNVHTICQSKDSDSRGILQVGESRKDDTERTDNDSIATAVTSTT